MLFFMPRDELIISIFVGLFLSCVGEQQYLSRNGLLAPIPAPR